MGDTPSPARDDYRLLAAHPPLMRSDERLLMGREAEAALDEIDRLRAEVAELRDATLVVECSEHDRSTVERLEADRDAAWGETQRLSTDLAELRALARMWEAVAVRWRERAERAEQDARLRSVSDTPQNSSDRGGTLKSGPQKSSQAAPSEDVVWIVMDGLRNVAWQAINASHRPENVRRWLDANSLHALACGALDALRAAGLLRGDTR